MTRKELLVLTLDFLLALVIVASVAALLDGAAYVFVTTLEEVTR